MKASPVHSLAVPSLDSELFLKHGSEFGFGSLGNGETCLMRFPMQVRWLCEHLRTLNLMSWVRESGSAAAAEATEGVDDFLTASSPISQLSERTKRSGMAKVAPAAVGVGGRGDWTQRPPQFRPVRGRHSAQRGPCGLAREHRS